MGVLYCLFMQSGLWDWNTGETTREIAHSDIAAAMGGLNYKTIRDAIRALREAGVLGYARKGVKWSNGEGKANRYKLLLPGLTPSQKTARPPAEKRPDPRVKNGQHYHSSIYSNGDAANLDRVPDPHRGGEMTTLGTLTNRHGYAEARRIWMAAETENEQSQFAAE